MFFKGIRKKLLNLFSKIKKQSKKAVLFVGRKLQFLLKLLKGLMLNIFKIIKNSFLKFIKFVLRNFTIILYLVLSILFFSLLILLVIQDRMGEVDTALKYVLLPMYIFSALFSGRIASKKIQHKIRVVLHREPESRWATNAEIIKNVDIKKIDPNKEAYSAAGLPFIVGKNEIYVDDGESHSLIIGSTGSGKTRRLVLPLINILARAGQSIVVTDPKGELYAKTNNLFKSLNYNVISINLRNPSEGNAWNPLSIPYEFYNKPGLRDKAIELIYDLGLNIFFDKTNKNTDPFWERSASNYFSGLVLALFEDASEKEINLNSVINMSEKGQEKFGINSNYIKEYFALKDKTNISYTSASGTVNAPNETRGGILSVFEQKLTIFSSKVELSKMLSYSDFTMSEIGTQKTAVFIIMQDEKSTYHPLVSAFIKQCYEVLIGTAQEHEGILPIRTNFVLDEFANLPPITDMSNMITAARSRNIRLNLIIQGAEQLNAQYGKETAEVIKGNCSNWFFLVSKELQLLKDLSELCGITEEQIGINKFRERPLITVSQLQRLKTGEILIRRDREHPFRANLPDISEYSYWKCTENSVNERENAREEVCIFDIEEYVKRAKREKVQESFNTVDKSSEKVQESFNTVDKSSEKVDIDKLIADIDKKIEELDKQEQEEKRKVGEKKKKEKKSKNSKMKQRNSVTRQKREHRRKF